jgi:hypothetical protein
MLGSERLDSSTSGATGIERFRPKEVSMRRSTTIPQTVL